MYVQLFKIHKCGFYKPHEEQRRFGAPREWYKDFLNWINIVSRDRADYSRTTTFPERDTVPTSIFCTGAVEDGRGNFGVALFNEGYRTDGGVEYIPRTGRMGSVPINVTSAPEDSRTGWTSYFWVMPDEELVVALMPEKKITSIASFRDYFKKYLERRSEYLYPICDSMTGEVLYYLYKGYLDAQPTPDASPIFETFQPVIYQNVQEIYNNWQNINRFFLHCEEEFLRMEPTTPLSRSFRRLLVPHIAKGSQEEENPGIEETIMRIERDWSPSSEEEVRKAIKWWTEEPKGEQEWAGVKFRGSDNTQYRFDKAKCMKEVDIDPSLEIGENNTRGWTEEQLKRVWEIARDTVKQLHQEISVYEEGVDHHETGSESSSQV